MKTREFIFKVLTVFDFRIPTSTKSHTELALETL